MTKTLRFSIKGALSSSIKPGLLAPAQFRGSTLDLDFAGAKSLKNQVGRQDVVSFTRASTATYVDGDGIIQSAAVDEARFDHDPATGESLGLLIEEARTNLIPHSNMGSGFNNNGVVNTFAPNKINPEGTTGDVRKIVATTEPGKLHQINYLASTANNLTVSVFVKFDNWRYVRVGFGGFSHSVMAVFDIDPSVTGNRLLLQGGNGTHSNIDAGYENYPNGWIRIWVSGTTNATGGPFVGLHPDATTTTTSNWAADGTESVFVYGIQYEDNVIFPTSYIPTNGSAVTRAADVVEITGANFSSFYNQTEGTVFVEASNYPHPVTGKALVPFAYSDNSYNNRITLASSTGNSQFNFDVTSGGSTQRAILGNFVSTGLKAAGGYKATGSAGSLDGASAVISSTSNIPSTISQLDIGNSHDGSQPLNGHIKRLVYFPVRLPDATLRKITY